MGAKVGVEIKLIIERNVEGRKSLATYEVVVEVGRKSREGGRYQRLANNQSHKTRRPSKTIALCGEPELRDGRGGTGSGRRA